MIPDTAKDKPQEGEMIAVGTGKRDEDGEVHALDVHEADRILFGKYAGSEIKIDGEELRRCLAWKTLYMPVSGWVHRPEDKVMEAFQPPFVFLRGIGISTAFLVPADGLRVFASLWNVRLLARNLAAAALARSTVV